MSTMKIQPENKKLQTKKPEWIAAMEPYSRPSLGRAIWQLVNSFVPYLALWALMIWTVRTGKSYWITLGIAVVAAAFLVRIFIFFHDCVHGSFFASRRANRILGYIIGTMTFTPYENWKIGHLKHHATSGDLDRRGLGDVWMMTVDEYLAASKGMRLAYRLYRNPLVMFGIGPAITFFWVQRFPDSTGGKRGRPSVILTNIFLLVGIVTAGLAMGFGTFAIIQLPVILLAGVYGLWLFYVQHFFPDVYWVRHGEWDPMKSALEGSSFYKLPKVFQWFSGNIGLHHIHHVRPNIPNYYLQRVQDEVPEVRAVKPLTLLSSLRCLFMNVWDEEQRRLISFRELDRRRAPSAG